MNRKLKRLLRQNVGAFFFLLLAFAVATALMNNYILALAELGVTAVAFIGFLIYRKHRRKELQLYL